MKIPFIKIYIDDEIKEEVSKVLDTGIYVEGEYTRRFEKLFADYIGVKYAVAVSNGTSALYLILKALGIGSGDKVAVPSYTFISTVSQVLELGAKPVFIDVDKDTYTMDVDDLEKKMDDNVKAIIPVHTFGHPANLSHINEIAQKYGSYVIEDSCQAHGAEFMGKKVGGLGYAGFFSFYPTKNMTVYGEGGMIVSNDYDLINEVRTLKNHGMVNKDKIVKLGYNMKFNEIQAALGIIQLKKLDEFNRRRRMNAEKYNEYLTNYVDIPIEAEYAYHVYHLYTIKTQKRDELKKYLESKGIGTGIYYKTPVHKQIVIKKYLDNIPKLPNTEYLSKRVLSIPIYPTLNDNELNYIIQSIINFFKSISS